MHGRHGRVSLHFRPNPLHSNAPYMSLKATLRPIYEALGHKPPLQTPSVGVSYAIGRAAWKADTLSGHHG